MRRIKLLKYEASCNYYGDYAESNNTCFSSSSPWLELEDDKLQELEGAVQKANALNKRSWRYVILYELNQENLEEIFVSADDFIKEQSKLEAKEKARVAKYQAEKDAKALKRKQAQLARLKKELESLE